MSEIPSLRRQARGWAGDDKLLIDPPCLFIVCVFRAGMLQRLCEELEYSELLDKASETDDPYERMVLIAAFAVSAYGSSHVRAGHKPFNPLLGETYECIREDKGFKYVSEQVRKKIKYFFFSCVWCVCVTK